MNDDRAVSPVVGVILVVAITVALAAVVGAFVLDLSDSTSDPATSGIDIDGDSVRLVDAGNADEVRVLDDTGSVVATLNSTGESTRLTDGKYTVVGVTNGQQTVLQHAEVGSPPFADPIGADIEQREDSYYEDNADIIVDQSGNGDYETIADGLSAATKGDTVYVRNGTYNEGGVDLDTDSLTFSMADGATLQGSLRIYNDDLLVDGASIDANGYNQGLYVASENSTIKVSDVHVDSPEYRGLWIHSDDTELTVVDSSFTSVPYSVATSGGIAVTGASTVEARNVNFDGYEGLTVDNGGAKVTVRESDFTSTNSNNGGSTVDLEENYWGGEPVYGLTHRRVQVDTYCDDSACATRSQVEHSVVSDDTSEEYQNLQEATDYATEGESFTVASSASHGATLNTNGITITGESGAELIDGALDIRADNVTVESLAFNDGEANDAIEVHSDVSDFTLADSTIKTANYRGVTVRDGAQADIVNSTITGMDYSVTLSGAIIVSSDARVNGQNLDLSGNYEAITVDGENATVNVHQSTLTDSIVEGYTNSTADVSENWWGTSDGPSDSDYNAGGGTVITDPYCTVADCSE